MTEHDGAARTSRTSTGAAALRARCFAEFLWPHVTRIDARRALLPGHKIPEILVLAHADTRRWHDDLAADGLPAHITALVIAAADGISTIPSWNHHSDPTALRDLETLLLTLTTNPTAWEHLAPPPK